MKSTFKIILLAFCCVPLFVLAQQENINPQAQQILNKSKSNFFIENKGQWPKEVRYLARIGGLNAWITKTGVVYDYYQIVRNYKHEEIQKLLPHEKIEFENKHTKKKGHIVNIDFDGANSDAKSYPLYKQEGYYNYFIGNDSSKWASFVKLYSEVLIKDIYPGIDIRYYFDADLIRYDYIANPGADISQINLTIKGSNSFKINENGELVLKTSIGKIIHGKLYSYQYIDNKKTEVNCSFTKNRNGDIGFNIEKYNPELVLIIDPLVYSTYLGGLFSDISNSIALDSLGNAIVAGCTMSSNYPTTTGAYDITFNNPNYPDAFITKINSTGTSLIFSTFIGGNNYDYISSVTIDNLNSIYISGRTNSPDYPSTSGAYNATSNSTAPNYYSDVMVTKFNATGSSLIYSTFLGGSLKDIANSIVCDKNYNIYVTGNANSIDFPSTAGAYDETNSGSNDVFVAKINPTGTNLIYSTFFGQQICTTNAYSIAIDQIGNAYITGVTNKYYKTTPGAYDTTYNIGGDGFCFKLNSTGSVVIYSTFIGGSLVEWGNSIKVDLNGNVYITGYTESTDFPTTTGAYSVTFNGGSTDDFVAKINSTGTALVYSTYIGGNNDEHSGCIELDSRGYSTITGTTLSTNFPTTLGAFSANLKLASFDDIFVCRLNPSGSGLVFSSLIGGSSFDNGNSLIIDDNGNSFITGTTSSSDYPTTIGAFDTTSNSTSPLYDAYVTKLWTVSPASIIVMSNVTGFGSTCKWTKGGATKRAVFIKQSNSGLCLPQNKNTYNANDTFGKGSQVGTTGWYCIYNDTGSSINIKGLMTTTLYTVMVCEYMGKNGNEIYRTDSVIGNPVTFSTSAVSQAHHINFSKYASNSITATWTNGTGLSRVVFVCAGNSGTAFPANNTTYTSNTVFGLGSQIGTTGWYCVYNGKGNTVDISGLASNTTYRLMVCEYYGAISKEQYITTIATQNPRNYYPIPTIQAQNILFSNLTSNSMKISWTNGNGSKRAVFCILADTGIAKPTNLTTYNADTAFGNGSKLGSSGWYCLYNGTSNSFSVSGLLAIQPIGLWYVNIMELELKRYIM